MSVNPSLIKEEIHRLSSLTQSVFNINQALRLANDQEKSILGELKDKLSKLSAVTDSEVDRFIDELKKTDTPSDKISHIAGNTATQYENSQMSLISQQYPILEQIFGAISNRMGQSSILNAPARRRAAPVRRRAPARRAPTRRAPAAPRRAPARRKAPARRRR